TGLGHGELIARHATPVVRTTWLPMLIAGELTGIAVTERHGGSRVREVTTRLVPAVGGGYRLVGEKCWISRLDEAAVFVVFAKDPMGRVAAAVIDGANPGLHRFPQQPVGLSGWSWGGLRLDSVRVTEEQLLGTPGTGLTIFRDHFAHYRPMVTATALGTAAGVHDAVCAHLASRQARYEITRVRDTAMVTIGRMFAGINAALLACLHAQRLSADQQPSADLWGRVAKAYGVDTAYQAVSELILLVGAAGFRFGHWMDKAKRDLNGLLYADGMHDSLYRSGGRTLLAMPVRDDGADVADKRIEGQRGA
ncbi:MAG: acyl-CoA dehydrogenase family protein, partial [Pseudonocardiaceae bacterium]